MKRIISLAVCLLILSSQAVAQESFEDQFVAALSLLKKQTEMAAAAVEGKRIYRDACQPCHGENGDGNGLYSKSLSPKPRDFTSGKYKFRTTTSRSLPTDQDILRSISKGIPGTFMPSWENILSEKQRMDLVQYIKTFSKRFADATASFEPIDVTKDVPYSEVSVAKGRKIFEQVECLKCHGNDGRGDGPSAADLKDEWDYAIQTPDLSQSWKFKGGNTRQDIYCRFMSGLSGTPMPSVAESFAFDDEIEEIRIMIEDGEEVTAEQQKKYEEAMAEIRENIWHLTNYVKSLSKNPG